MATTYDELPSGECVLAYFDATNDNELVKRFGRSDEVLGVRQAPAWWPRVSTRDWRFTHSYHRNPSSGTLRPEDGLLNTDRICRSSRAELCSLQDDIGSPGSNDVGSVAFSFTQSAEFSPGSPPRARLRRVSVIVHCGGDRFLL